MDELIEIVDPVPAWLLPEPKEVGSVTVRLPVAASGLVLKHLAGQHDQSSHGRHGGSVKMGGVVTTDVVPAEVAPLFGAVDKLLVEHPELFNPNKEGQSWTVAEPELAAAYDAAELSVAKYYKEHGFNGHPVSGTEAMELGSVMRVRHSAEFLASQKKSDDELKLADDVLKMVASQDVVVRMNEQGLWGTVLDGKMKNQFEIERSNGIYDRSRRKEVELSSQLVDTAADPTVRPIYGVMGVRDNGNLEQYGGCRVVLKPSVRDRTTITVGDSLMGRGVAMPLSSPSRTRIIASCKERAVWNPAQKLWTDMAKTHSANGSKSDLEGLIASRIGYIEAQIHGGVQVSDIAKVILPSGSDADLVSRLQSLGISVETS